MNDSVKDFVDSLFKSQTTEPSANAAEQWIEKLASINDPKTEDKKMGKLRDELNGMDLDQLTELANELVGYEKVAGITEEVEGLSEEEIELLKNVSYADYLRAQESLQKEAEESEEIDPEEISAYDALMMQEGEEKTAETEEDEEEVPEHIRIGYEQGAAMAYGLSDGLYSVNGEKTAETREDIIDFIEGELEKDAGGAMNRLRALLKRGKNYAVKQGRGLRNAARSPYGKQKKTMGKLKNIAAKGLYYGGVPAGAAAAGTGAGYAARKRREGK